MTAAARNDRLIFHSSRHQPNPKLIGLLAVTSPATLSQYLSFISRILPLL